MSNRVVTVASVYWNSHYHWMVEAEAVAEDLDLVVAVVVEVLILVGTTHHHNN